jgi:hypothetical protein
MPTITKKSQRPAGARARPPYGFFVPCLPVYGFTLPFVLGTSPPWSRMGSPRLG